LNYFQNNILKLINKENIESNTEIEPKFLLEMKNKILNKKSNNNYNEKVKKDFFLKNYYTHFLNSIKIYFNNLKLIIEKLFLERDIEIKKKTKIAILIL
jgi:hypothetical protein